MRCVSDKGLEFSADWDLAMSMRPTLHTSLAHKIYYSCVNNLPEIQQDIHQYNLIYEWILPETEDDA